MKKRTLLSWSSGKDSAWALHILQQDSGIELVGLFTVINKQYQRASMHATRIDVLKHQAAAVGLPLQTIEIPEPCTNEQCNEVMAQFITECSSAGIEYMAFGDLFLEDIRRYRENQLQGSGIKPLFPLWGKPTWQLAEQMLSSGLEAYISSVDLAKLPRHFAGKKWNREILDLIPAECDPCGENGEIHTIVTAGPMFDHALPIRVGEIIERNGFVYADIIPS